MKVLCVAEKPSISKAVAGHLSGGGFQTVSSLPIYHRFPYHSQASYKRNCCMRLEILIDGYSEILEINTSKTTHLALILGSLGVSVMST